MKINMTTLRLHVSPRALFASQFSDILINSDFSYNNIYKRDMIKKRHKDKHIVTLRFIMEMNSLETQLLRAQWDI